MHTKGFDQLELMIVFDQSGHMLVLSFWPIRALARFWPIRAHAGFCPIRSKTHASISLIWSEKKKQNQSWLIFDGFSRFCFEFRCYFILSAFPVFASITVHQRLDCTSLSSLRDVWAQWIRATTAIFSRRDIIQGRYVPNKALSSFKYFLFKTSKHNLFLFPC